VFLVAIHRLFVLSYYVSLRSLVMCCDVRYDFRKKMMFGSSLLPVVCRKVYLRYLCLIAHNEYKYYLFKSVKTVYTGTD
jgi:hypothetical protein